MSDNIATRWAVYESNVQQYRILSATVQSFLLAVAGIWANPPAPRGIVLIVCMAILGVLHIYFVWLPVVFARVLILDYYKGQLEMGADLREKLVVECTEQEFVRDVTKREQTARTYFAPELRQPLRSTRAKLDRWVPWGYTLIWVGLVAWYVVAASQASCAPTVAPIPGTPVSAPASK